MVRTKRLRSVVHSIAQHAMSGLCYVNPHLGRARKPLGVTRVAVDLLQAGVEPMPVPMTREIEESTDALRETFSALLAKESVDIGELVSAVATFFYRGDCTWPDACLVQVETKSGTKLEDA